MGQIDKRGDLKQVNKNYAHDGRITPLLAVVGTVSALPMNIKTGGK